MLREEPQPSALQAQISEANGEEEVIYVALGTHDFKKDARMLLWVLENFPGCRVSIIHVHWPSKRIGILGAKFPSSWVSEQLGRKHREEEKRKMKELLYAYMKICTERKVQVGAYFTVEEDVFKGVQDFVNQHKIKRLVMGSRLMSKKEELLSRCQIWLVCNGHHISTSEPIINQSEAQTVEEENQERLLSTLVLDPDEYHQYITPPNEWDDEIADNEEAQNLMQEVTENPIRHQTAACAENVLLLKLMIEELKGKLEKAEEKVQLSLEEKLELQQQVTTLQQKIFEQAREIQELRKPQGSIELTFSELQKATNNFHPSHKIGEGGYGPVYKGVLRETLVAIKILNPSSNQGHFEYQQEVIVLSRIRHRNIVQLIGICSESSALVYEYLENGSVEERLSRRNNTPPLSWQLRIRIIVEQRLVLIFLHSNKPCIVHIDMKCHNILLDANNVSRLGDFGTARMLHQEISEETALCRNTTPMGTVGYMDPTFLATGELTPKVDTFSFGVVILRLLTGLPVLRIAEQVEEALRMGALRQVLDASAGEWPMVQTEQLLRLALRCSHSDRSQRPDLMSDDWRTLEILRAMAGYA